MSYPVSLKQSHDSVCLHNPHQIVTCNANTMSTSPTNDFRKRPIVTPTSTRTLKKNLISVPNSNIMFFLDCQIPIFLFYHIVRKQRNVK